MKIFSVLLMTTALIYSVTAIADKELLFFVDENDVNPFLQDVLRSTVTEESRAKEIKQIKDLESNDKIKKLSITPFHYRAEVVDERQQSICLQCHQSLPHRENETLRAFQNMHTQFIDCLTCHYQPEDKKIKAQWFDKNWQALDLSQAGSKKESLQDNLNKKSSLIPQNGAKIHLVYKDNRISTLLNSEFSQELIRQWKRGDEAAKAELKARFHQPIENEGLVCNACHQHQQTRLDLLSLGASDVQVELIEKNTIARFMEKVDKEEKRIRLQDFLE